MLEERRRRVIVMQILFAAPGFLLLLVSRSFWGNPLAYGMRSVCTYWLLIPAAFIDYQHQIIPNRLMPIGFSIALVFMVHDRIAGGIALQEKLFSCCLGMLLGAGVFFLAAILSKGGVGMGDVKLFGILGFLLELQAVFQVLFYTLLCAAVCSVFLLMTKRASAGTRIAVAPFALVGVALTILSGG